MTIKNHKGEGGWNVYYDCPNCSTTYWAGIIGQYFCEICGCELENRSSGIEVQTPKDILIQNHFNSGVIARKQTLETQADNILKAAEILATAFMSGNKVLLCGNGGSAADCQHMATEFISGISWRDTFLPAVALTTDTSFITSRGNDSDFAEIFQSQVATLGIRGDVLICISTSGNSVNVIRAAGEARENGLQVIILTGKKGGKLKSLGEAVIQAQSNDTQIIQEILIAVEHILVKLVEHELSISGWVWNSKKPAPDASSR